MTGNTRNSKKLLIVNTLPEDDTAAQSAIRELQSQAPDTEWQVIHAYEKNFRPCIGCNACWLKTPGQCAVRDGYEELLRDYLAADAFYGNEHILIALPLYVESIPGILLEFLSALKIKTRPGTKLAFLLQGGFPEASQSRCCEAYLETLPAQLGCEYAGTLIKGDMFGVGLVNEKEQRKMLAPFTEMGRYFANTGAFEKSVVDEFAAPEYLSERKIRFNRFMQPVFDLLKRYIVKKLGCTGKLDARPLTEGR